MNTLIKSTLLAVAVSLGLAACQQEVPQPAPVPSPDPVVVPAEPPPMPVVAFDQVASDAAVAAIEGRMATDLVRREIALEADALAGNSETVWSKMHVYSDAAGPVRIKLYPVADSEKTEEFYFQDGKLLLVVIEPQGSTESNDVDAPGERWYFADGVLRATVATDGSIGDATSAAAQAMAAKLLAEVEQLQVLAQ